MDLSKHTLFGVDTDNQTVNAIPAVQFRCPLVVTAATPYARQGDPSPSRRLGDFFKSKGITHTVIPVSEQDETDFHRLIGLILPKVRTERAIAWNLTGGQKPFQIALYECWRRRVEEGKPDVLVYLNRPSPPRSGETIIYTRPEERVVIPTRSDLDLDDILLLYGYTSREKRRLLPSESDPFPPAVRKASKLFLSDPVFREAFFAFLKPYTRETSEWDKVLIQTLNNLKPRLEDVVPPETSFYRNALLGLEELETSLFQPNPNFAHLRDIFRRCLGTFHNVRAVFDEHWAAVRRKAVDLAASLLQKKDFPLLLSSELSPDQRLGLAKAIGSIGGQADFPETGPLLRSHIRSFSSLGSNAELFEKMVAAETVDTIRQHAPLRDRFLAVYANVKVAPITRPTAIDAELDLVLVTRDGTLLVFEVKTFEFSGAEARAKLDATLKFSGPYGRVVIVAPLIRSMVKGRRDDGQPVYEDYLPAQLLTQKDTASRLRITHLDFDRISPFLLSLVEQGPSDTPRP